MSSFWWYFTRATGMVATGLVIAALVWGFFFSARNTGIRRRPNWWLDLHNYLGGLALIFTGLHVVAAVLDRGSGLGVLQALVPGTAGAQAWAVGWGVVAAHLFVVTVLTSWPRRRLSRRVWRAVHLGSVIGTVLAIVHALQLGSDATGVLLRVELVLGVGIGVYALSVRLIDVAARRSSR